MPVAGASGEREINQVSLTISLPPGIGCSDVDSLSRLRSEVLRGTTARACYPEGKTAIHNLESLGFSMPVVSVPETVASGHSSGMGGIIYSHADSRHRAGDCVASTATSPLEASDVSASSALAAGDPTPNRSMKRARFDEAVPPRRSSRIAERSRVAGTGALSSRLV